MSRAPGVHPPVELAMPGWIRQCAMCGTPDIHAVYPTVSMLDRPSWSCSACGCGRHAAVHVPFDASQCPAMQASAPMAPARGATP